jgi:hypothetical protein
MALRLPSSAAVQVGGKRERFFCRLGLGGNDGDRAEVGVNPGNEAQAPIAGIQAYQAGADAIQTDRPAEQGAGEGGIVRVGGREQEKQG